MTVTPILDYEAEYPPFRLRDSARAAWKATGKQPAAQALEMWKLRRSFGRLSPREYYFFRLYEDTRFSFADKARFVGAEVTGQIRRLSNDRNWWAVRRDKLVFYGLMQGYGFPIPKVRAVFHPFRHMAGALALRTAREVQTFLRDSSGTPFFGKPVLSGRGLGLVYVDRYDPATDELVSSQGLRFSVADFLVSIERYSKAGYLFQEVLRPHDDVRVVCGDRLATVRVLVLLGRSGPELFRAFWKVPVAPHIDDTFWRAGNMVAALDLKTGRVKHAITGSGIGSREVDRHPDTGALLADFTLPNWTKLRELCLVAAATMPGVALQGWDLAPCSQGPVLIEGDAGGSFAVPQLVDRVGLLDDKFLAFLETVGFRSRGPLTRVVDGLRHRWRRRPWARPASARAAQ